MGFEGLKGLVAGAQGFTALTGGIVQSQAIQARSEYEAGQLELNAQLSEIMAKDAIERGDEQLRDFSTIVNRVIGQQRVGFAGQNVDVSSGSAREAKEDAERIAFDTSVRLRNNAWREAWGYNVRSENLRSQANLARIAGDFNANQTLLSGINRSLGFGIESLNLSNKALKNYFDNNQQTGGDSRRQLANPFDISGEFNLDFNLNEDL